MYKLFKNLNDNIVVLNTATNTSFLTSPANTDYANFKKEILADEAQLQNADGVLMSADEAQTYVRSLP